MTTVQAIDDLNSLDPAWQRRGSTRLRRRFAQLRGGIGRRTRGKLDNAFEFLRFRVELVLVEAAPVAEVTLEKLFPKLIAF